MFLHKRKRTNLTIEEKKWILRHADNNDKLSRAKIALDFSTKFNRSITGQCVCNVISKKTEILGTIQAMVQSYNFSLIDKDSQIGINAT